MAKGKAKKENKFLEFDFEGENGNDFSGRVYDAVETKNATYYPLSLTINGLAVVGCKFWKTSKSNYITYPEYKDKNGDYHSIIYFFDKDDIKDINALAEHLNELVDD